MSPRSLSRVSRLSSGLVKLGGSKSGRPSVFGAATVTREPLHSRVGRPEISALAEFQQALRQLGIEQGAGGASGLVE